MVKMVEYFFDTYAIIEILENNPNFEKFSMSLITTFHMNLVETYMHFFRKYNEETAKSIFYSIKNSEISVEDEVVFEAIKIKREHNKKKLSYVDCLGYAYAKLKGIKFLTGDKEFEGMKNVEFVK